MTGPQRSQPCKDAHKVTDKVIGEVSHRDVIYSGRPSGRSLRAVVVDAAAVVFAVILVVAVAACSSEGPAKRPGRTAVSGTATGRAKPASTPAPPSAPPHFHDVTSSAGIHFVATNGRSARRYLVETMGSGCGFIDYDRDGWQDILLLNGRKLEGNQGSRGESILFTTPHLYHNNHDGTFTDVTQKAGLAHSMYAMGCAVGDYDNDGYDDIYISCVLGPGHLYHNNRNGTFTDVTAHAGVENAGQWGTSCTWVDVDNDGWLDLFVCNYVRYRNLADDLPCFVKPGQPTYCIPSAFTTSHCVLYHNNHDGTFTDISASSGIAAAKGKSLGVVVWDYDHDGRPDLFVANDTVAGFVFHNLGHNHFEEVGTIDGIAYSEDGSPHSGMGIDASDLWNNGKTSVVITNFSGQETALYNEVGSFSFQDVASQIGIAAPSRDRLGFGALFVDYDNDGFKDLFVVNGHVQDDISTRQPGITYAEPPLLYHNQRNGMFRDVTPTAGSPFTRAMVARGAASGDFDNDGRVDLLITTNGGPAYLWRNETSSTNRWLTLSLTGVRSNRDGIGAVATVTGGGVTQTGMVRGGSGYLSASDLRLHFGVSTARFVDLAVRWPSGSVDRISHVETSRSYRLVEGAGRLKDAP